MTKHHSFLPVMFMTLAAIASFSALAQDQPVGLAPPTADPMTQPEFTHVQNSNEYKALQGIRKLTLDFTRGERFVYTDQHLTLFLLPIVEGLPNKFAYFLQSDDGSEEKLFVLEFSPVDQSKTNLHINISDVPGANSLDLSYSSGKLVNTQMHGELLSTHTSAEARQTTMSARFPMPRNLWRFWICMLDNGAINDSYFCSECVWGMLLVLGGDPAGTDIMSLNCPVCANTMTSIFQFCWTYANR